MTKSFTCTDIGIDCKWSASGETVEEVLKQVAEHASKHGVTEVTPELVEKVTKAIKDNCSC